MFISTESSATAAAADLCTQMEEISSHLAPEVAARCNERLFDEWLLAVTDPEFYEAAVTEQRWMGRAAASGLM